MFKNISPSLLVSLFVAATSVSADPAEKKAEPAAPATPAVPAVPATPAPVKWIDAPEAVQKVAKTDSAGGAISVVKKEEYDKAPAWEIIFTLKGREYERVYAADGKLLVAEEVMTVEEAPKPVQAAIQKAYGHTKAKVEKMTERGVTYYEAGAEGKELLFTPTGEPTEKPKGATR
jgi:hypothetical protein